MAGRFPQKLYRVAFNTRTSRFCGREIIPGTLQAAADIYISFELLLAIEGSRSEGVFRHRRHDAVEGFGGRWKSQYIYEETCVRDVLK